MQNKFFNSKLNTVLLFILIILMIIALRWMHQDKEKYIPVIYTEQVQENNKIEIGGNKDDLVAFSVLPNTEVHGILSYRGTIKGGYFFEGNILINILDENKKVIKRSNAVAKTDWMTSGPVDFEGNIDFSGLSKGGAYFEIHNDNASGLPENDKFIRIPITIK